MPKHTETKISSEEIFKGYVFTVTKDIVSLENGKQATREVVHHNSNASAVVALNSKGEVALVRQFRYPVGRQTTEIPAGKIDAGETPLETAKRELEEETGFVADNFFDLNHVLPTSAYCTEIIYLFVATGLHESTQKLDEDEFLDILWKPLDEVVELILNGGIVDSKTVCAILRTHALVNNGTILIRN